MKNLVLAVLFATLTTVALAQAPTAPPVALSERAVTMARIAAAPQLAEKPDGLYFCPPKSCLYYAGDPDLTNTSNENALFDFDNPGIGITDAEVWVGVKPTKNAVITGAAGNYATNAGAIGINPTPFAIRTGISSGNGGKLVCSTHGNAVYTYCYPYSNQCYGIGYGLPSDNYYIAKLAKACHVKAGKTYYIDLTPQYNDNSTIGYLEDVEDKKPAHHKGWPNVWDDSYFNSTSFGVTYEPTWGSSGACGGVGCDLFSMALTGRK